MPLSLMTLSLVDSPVTVEEGRKILERDDYRCQYCGLDGRASFENALVMRVDFVIPRARKGKKDPSNLVACFTPRSAWPRSWNPLASFAPPATPLSSGPSTSTAAPPNPSFRTQKGDTFSPAFAPANESACGCEES